MINISSINLNQETKNKINSTKNYNNSIHNSNLLNSNTSITFCSDLLKSDRKNIAAIYKKLDKFFTSYAKKKHSLGDNVKIILTEPTSISKKIGTNNINISRKFNEFNVVTSNKEGFSDVTFNKSGDARYDDGSGFDFYFDELTDGHEQAATLKDNVSKVLESLKKKTTLK